MRSGENQENQKGKKEMGEKIEYKMHPYPDNLLLFAGLEDCLPLTAEREKGLEYVLSKMPPRRAEAVRLFFRENKTQVEAGKVLGVSGSRVGYLLHEAARILRRQENRECIFKGYSSYMAMLQEKENEAENWKEYLKTHPEAIRIQDAGFTRAAERAFLSAGLQTVGDVVHLIGQENYYRCFWSYGPAADQKVRKRLAELGIML